MTYSTHDLSDRIEILADGRPVAFVKRQKISPAATLAQRFCARVILGPDCWDWHGTKTQGYGRLAIGKGKANLAHRVSYHLFVGAVPDEMFVCHHCDNPSCVNPTHLFVGNQDDNMKDASRKGRLPSHMRTHCYRGHELTEQNSYWHVKRGRRSCRECRRAADRRRSQS